MSPISTHVLDMTAGRPIANLPVTLERRGPDGPWRVIAQGRTDADGRIRDLLPGDCALDTGPYRLRFDTSAHSAFFPEVLLCFQVDDPSQHFHLPLLFSPFGYTTYRGS